MHIIRYHTSESPAPLVGVRDEGQVFGLPGVGQSNRVELATSLVIRSSTAAPTPDGPDQPKVHR